MLCNRTTVVGVSPLAIRRRIVVILVAIAGACLVGLLIYGVSLQTASRTLDEQVALRRHPPAPDSARGLPLLGGGGRASLASYRGQVVVLNFWASWCQPCRSEAPLLQRAQAALAGHRATVLGVTYLDTSTDAQGFVRRYHLGYPQLRDNNGDFAHAYGTNQLPETFVIDRGGHIEAMSRGEVDQAFLNRAVGLAQRT
jgi:cytochrome c biogenesis protein CcmG/thiol:disulfide interchange protein DsbE